MAVLEIEGKRVEVDDSFKTLSPEQQAATVEEIASSMGITAQRPDIMGQVNAGIGDVVDFLNPFDDDAVSQALGMGDRLSTGSAADAMNAVGINAATDAPQGFVEGLARGGGNAAASGPLAGVTLAGLRNVGGAVGQAADDAFQALTTLRGFLAETSAGAVSRGAEEAVEEAGGGELAQGLAAVAAPMAAPLSVMAARGGAGAAQKVPGIVAGTRIARDIKRGLLPMTEGGAHEQAASRLRDLAGGEDRAAELARSIEVDNEFGLTAAEQTEDPNLIGLQRSVADENPVVRERLEAQRAGVDQNITAATRAMGGDVADARAFFDQRRSEYSRNLSERIDRVISGADAQVQAAGPRTTEAANSTSLVGRLKNELNDALSEEAALWAAVPRDVELQAESAAQTARALIEQTPRAQRNDIPSVLQSALDDGNELAAPSNVAELHGLYSELRRVARSAMAGNDQNKNKARIANAVADSIMEDFAGAGIQSIDEARAFSRTLHEKFDQGAVGRILKRTIDGDESMTPEAALDRTVGRGGSTAMADNQSIRAAAPQAGEDVQDYLRSRFSEAIFNASGEFTPKAAKTWLRNNQEVLGQYPGLGSRLRRTLRDRDTAQSFSIRAAERMKLADQGPIKDFNSGQADKAITAIIGADSPIKAAKSIAATAAKDTSGKALAGVKGAFADYLTQDTSKLPALLADPKIRASMAQVFDKREMNRFNRISQAMQKANAPSRNVGDAMNSPAMQIVEYAARFIAVQAAGGQGNSAGASLQIANMASGRAKRFVENLTNDRARRMLTDAIEDPELFKALLATPRAIEANPRIRSKLAPYLVGVGAAQGTEQ